MSNFRWLSWLSVTESFIPFHILSHPSSPLHSNRPRWSKCLTFVARMYYFKAPVLLSTGVLVYWFAVFQRRCASFYPVKLQFVCSWPQVLYICPNDTFAFWLPSIIDSYIVIFRMLIQMRSSYPELTLRKNEIYTFWSQISHAFKCPRWLNKNEVWIYFRLRQAPFIAYQSKQNLTLDALGTWINSTL